MTKKLKIAKAIYESKLSPSVKLYYLKEIKKLSENEIITYLKTSSSLLEGPITKALKYGYTGMIAGGTGLITARLIKGIKTNLNSCIQNCKTQYKVLKDKEKFSKCMDICQKREQISKQQIKSKAGLK